MPTPQSATVELFIDGAWVTAPAFSNQGPISSQIGPDVETGTRASKLDGTINNDTLNWDPENAAGIYYGKIGRNTKVRASVSSATLTQAEMSEWDVSRTSEHVSGTNRGLAMVSFAAEGVLRRINKWTDPINSAMFRSIQSVPTLLGYFPMEDPSGAGTVSNLVTNGQFAATNGTVTFAGADGPAGSDKVLKLGSEGQVTGVWARPVANTAGFQLGFSMALDVLPATGTYEPFFRFSTSAGHIYTLFINNASYDFRITTADGTALGSSGSVLFGAGVDPTKWISYRLKITDIGTQVQVEPGWYPQDASVLYGITFAFTAPANGVLIDWGGVRPATAYGHLFATESTAVNLQTAAYLAAFNGYLGERAGRRTQRLFQEAGMSFYSLGDLDATAIMGRQRPDVFLDLIEECLRTDGALLYDEVADAGACTFVCRNYRTSLTTPALSLTYPTHIASYQRVTGDTGIANDVTADNADGQQANVTLTAGRMSISAPPAGISRVKKKIDVNYRYTTDLIARAQFELAKSSLDRPRYPSITIDLVANPGLIAAVVALRPGQLVQITGLEPDPVRVHVLSIAQTIGAIARTATITTLPAEVYDAGVYDAAGTLYDSGSTTLASGATTTATSLAITTADAREVWPTSGFPYVWKIAGERMNVTGMTAGVGTGPVTQTATVTRSINGVVKTLPAGAEIHLADPKRYA